MRETEKVIELLGRKWKLTKLNPLEGSNLIRKFVRGQQFQPQDFLVQLPDEEFASIQRALLRSVFEIKVVADKEIPLPVFSGDMLAIEFNSADEAFVITAVSLAFNLQGFFAGDALKEFADIVKTFSASNQ